MFTKFRHTNYHLCPALTLAKLYSNSLLVLFNNRIRISRGLISATTEDAAGSVWNVRPGGVGIFARGPTSSRSANTPKESSRLPVHVNISKQVTSDAISMDHIDVSIAILAESINHTDKYIKDIHQRDSSSHDDIIMKTDPTAVC